MAKDEFRNLGFADEKSDGKFEKVEAEKGVKGELQW